MYRSSVRVFSLRCKLAKITPQHSRRPRYKRAGACGIQVGLGELKKALRLGGNRIGACFNRPLPLRQLLAVLLLLLLLLVLVVVLVLVLVLWFPPDAHWG